MKNILRIISDVLYPVRCICCGSLDSNKIICGECCKCIEKEAIIECANCKSPPDLCKCRKILHIDGIFYKYFYIGNKIRRTIYRYKRENLYYINEFFAKEMFTLVEKSDRINMDDIDFITNVPRRRKSVRYFGYDQTRNLAKLISKYLGIPYRPLLMVAGSKDYKEQKKLNYKDRVENVKNKFVPIEITSISDKNILLVDDIVSTGSTLSECARVMKNTGAKKVYALCIASSYFSSYFS